MIHTELSFNARPIRPVRQPRGDDAQKTELGRRFGRRAALGMLLAAAPAAAQTAAAAQSPAILTGSLFRRRYLETSWDRRRLRAVRQETGERFAGVYFEFGAPLRAERTALDWLMRDVRSAEACEMSPALIELLRKVQSACGDRELVITSGYRTAETNAQLAKRGAAPNSMHLHGAAVDFYVPGVSVPKLARLVAEQRAGGVGVYERRGFVHADTGPIRHWRG